MISWFVHQNEDKNSVPHTVACPFLQTTFSATWRQSPGEVETRCPLVCFLSNCLVPDDPGRLVRLVTNSMKKSVQCQSPEDEIRALSTWGNLSNGVARINKSSQKFLKQLSNFTKISINLKMFPSKLSVSTSRGCNRKGRMIFKFKVAVCKHLNLSSHTEIR